MKKVKIVEQKIRLSSALALEMEVNGFTKFNEKREPIFVLEGLIEKTLSAATKYWLDKISQKLKKEKDSHEKRREELIKKYGEEKEDSKSGKKYFGIEPMIKDPEFKVPKLKKGETFDEKNWPMIPNPNLLEFYKEMNELVKQVVEIKIPKFDIDELFCFKTDYNYTNSYHFLVQEDEEDFEYTDLEYNDLEYNEEEIVEESKDDKKD